MILAVSILIILAEFAYIMRLNRKLGSLKQDNEVLVTTIRIKNEQLKAMSEPDVDMPTLLERMHNGIL